MCVSCRDVDAEVAADVDSAIADLSASAVEELDSAPGAIAFSPEDELTFRAAANSPVHGTEAAQPEKTSAEPSSSVISMPAKLQSDKSAVQSSDYWLAVGLHMPTAKAASGQPDRMTADIDDSIADLMPSAVSSSAAHLHSEVPTELQSTDYWLAVGLHMPTAAPGQSQPVHVADDVDDTLADLRPAPVSSSAPVHSEEIAMQSEPQPMQSEPQPMQSEPQPLQSEPQPMQSEPQSVDYWLAVGLHMPTAEPVRMTANIDDTIADLMPSAVGSSAHVHSDQPIMQSELTSSDYWLAVGLHMPMDSSQTAQQDRMTEGVDASLAGLSPSLAQHSPEDVSDAASDAALTAEPVVCLADSLPTPSPDADSAHPERLTEDVEATLAGLSASVCQHADENESDSQPSRVTPDIDAAVADLTSSAVHTPTQEEDSQLEESQNEHMDSEQPQRLTADVDVILAELSTSAAELADEQQQPDADVHAEMGDADQDPMRLTADVDEAVLELAASAAELAAGPQSPSEASWHETAADADQAPDGESSAAVQNAAELQQQKSWQTAEVHDTTDDMVSSAAGATEEEPIFQETEQPMRLTAEVNEAVEHLSVSAISHAAQQQQHEPEAAVEAADAADVVTDDSYILGSEEPALSPAPETAGAAVSVDVPLEDDYQADEFESGEAAEAAAVAAAVVAEETEAGMPDRPASPVAMQLAMLSPEEHTSAVESPTDRSAPASLAGDKPGIAECLCLFPGLCRLKQ